MIPRSTEQSLFSLSLSLQGDRLRGTEYGVGSCPLQRIMGRERVLPTFRLNQPTAPFSPDELWAEEKPQEQSST